ncbi:MAG TPA: PQQ-dependent sugar dehydrogenase [Micromonosporaceae bacterium]|nr:PQQ-dependent sugar dehydrogenase [Micromonosporaceae bacterium]
MTAPGLRTVTPCPPHGVRRSGARRSIARRALATATTIAAVAVTVAGCAFGPPPPDQGGEPPNLPPPSASIPSDGGSTTVDVLAKHLSTPWGLAFLPDGTALVTERASGKILRVGLPQLATGLTVTPIATVSGIDPTGEGGLLGIAASPNVTADHTVFLYYSTAKDNRIGTVRLPASAFAPPASASPASPPGSPAPSTGPGSPPAGGSDAPPPAITPKPVLTGIPRGATDNGGWLAFGPDHMLYASTGDTGRPALSQNRASLAGKILRMTATGRPVAGGSLVYAIGLHNVQGFAWDAAGQMFTVDTAGTDDGVLPIRAGANYGWPTASPSPGSPSDSHIVPPIQTFPADQSGCAGVAAIDDIIATACLTGQRLWLMQVTAGAVFGAPQPGLVGQFGRLRTTVTAPDGSLWITTSNTDGDGTPASDDDQILRVVITDEGAGRL